MSLIEDYIQILFSKTFFDNTFTIPTLSCDEKQIFNKTKNLTYELYGLYEELFKKLKMDDLSLLILKKEIKNNNNLFLQEKQNNFQTLYLKIMQINKQLNKIINALKEKQKILNFQCNNFNKSF